MRPVPRIHRRRSLPADPFGLGAQVGTTAAGGGTVTWCSSHVVGGRPGSIGMSATTSREKIV